MILNTRCLFNLKVVDKVKMQLDAFLEDGSHVVTNAVIHAVSAAISVKSSSLQDYILLKRGQSR